MTSIRQNNELYYLPEFRNFGVILRIVIGINLLALLAALLHINSFSGWLNHYLDISFFIEILLFIDLLICALLSNQLHRLPGRLGQTSTILLVSLTNMIAVSIGYQWSQDLFEHRPPDLGLVLTYSTLSTIVILAYFEIRSRLLSPAIAEARLQALTARIRPHFLFNSLNAVLSIIRTDPLRAEETLEELAELFRVLMQEHHALVTLSDEINFCRQYLDIEKLRLGNRLEVSWNIVGKIDKISVPSLMMQPLVENAVYHGIEPNAEKGIIEIHIERHYHHLVIEVTNPLAKDEQKRPHTVGNKMALENIRERLKLYYDLEARLDLFKTSGSFRVKITLPCRT